LIMNYLDGFIAAVPAANKEAYLKHAADSAAVLKEYGALRSVQCWGDDAPDGKLTSFPLAVKLEEGEVVVFTWVESPSKAVRDAAWEKSTTDPRVHRQKGCGHTRSSLKKASARHAMVLGQLAAIGLHPRLKLALLAPTTRARSGLQRSSTHHASLIQYKSKHRRD
jgi:uncharacterized protein YbaA (DUF1428 family)